MVEQHELEVNWSLVTDQEQLKRAAESLNEGVGPTGVDAERASGYRYRSDAYLVQVHRTGSGTFLFDPVTLEDFSPLAEAIGETEWVLHAASQDLECLRGLGLEPPRLFDTELASRLLGFERVGLGSIVEKLLGVKLHKAHSSADWSTRPLPEPWLEYAALDVVLLPDLREEVAAELEAQNKTEFAEQEFSATLNRAPKPAVAEPWRKLAGGNRLSTPRELTIARELWNARDAYAQEIDVAPGRLLPDTSLIAAARQNPRSLAQLASNPEFKGRASKSQLPRWWKAILKAKTAEPPTPRPRVESEMPNHRSWPQRFPLAAARLALAREAVMAEAQRQHMPVETLISPDTLRRLVWQPPEPVSVEAVADRLRELGARTWQSQLIAPILAPLFVES